MKYLKLLIITCALFFGVSTTASAAQCTGGVEILGFPTWYQYLECDAEGAPTMEADRFLPNLLLIGLAVLELLTRIAGLLATGYVIWGGIRFITSQGSPEGTKDARNTITNALIGLVITVIATSLIATVAQVLSKGYN